MDTKMSREDTVKILDELQQVRSKDIWTRKEWADVRRLLADYVAQEGDLPTRGKAQSVLEVMREMEKKFGK